MTNPVATVWRDDGVINYVLPKEIATETLLIFSKSHGKWTCTLMGEFMGVTSLEDVVLLEPELVDVYPKIMDGLSGHDVSDEPSRMHEGTPDMFDGMVYGTMHPVELASLGVAADVLLDMLRIVPADETTADVRTVLQFWRDMSKQFVRPSEAIAVEYPPYEGVN